MGRRSLVSRNGVCQKTGRVYIAAGEEEYRLLNPPLQEYVTPGWLGRRSLVSRNGVCLCQKNRVSSILSWFGISLSVFICLQPAH
ncbi:hypothetical protein B9T16_28505 [Arthrospira sp. PCC 8006]